MQIAAVATVALAVWFAVIIADHGWNPSTLVAAGEDDRTVSTYIADRLGPDFAFQADWGHDGKHAFIQAHDPWLVHPEAHASFLDAPVYRSQRVVVPMVLSVGTLFGEWGVVWAFPVMMVAMAALGVWATAGLIELGGRSGWWGLLFLANPGMFYSYRRGTVDVAAVALLLLGVYLGQQRRYRPAAAALAMAVLTKEVMVLGALGLAFHRRRDGRAVLPLLVWPVTTGVAWAAYVRWRLDGPILDAGAEVITAPLAGVVGAIGSRPMPDAVVAATVMVVAGGALLMAWRRPSPVIAAAIGFALLLPLLPVAVLGGYVDAWRATAPVIALLIPALLTVGRSRATAAAGPASVRETELVAA